MKLAPRHRYMALFTVGETLALTDAENCVLSVSAFHGLVTSVTKDLPRNDVFSSAIKLGPV